MPLLTGIFYFILYLSLHHYCVSAYSRTTGFCFGEHPSAFSLGLYSICVWVTAVVAVIAACLLFCQPHLLPVARSTWFIICARARFYFDFLSHIFVKSAFENIAQPENTERHDDFISPNNCHLKKQYNCWCLLCFECCRWTRGSCCTIIFQCALYTHNRTRVGLQTNMQVRVCCGRKAMILKFQWNFYYQTMT